MTADADRMTAAEPQAVCSLASRFPDSIALSSVGGGEPTQFLGPTTVENEGLERAVSASLTRYGLSSAAGGDPRFTLRVTFADMVRSGAGFTTSTTVFVRFSLHGAESGDRIYDDVVAGQSTLSVGDVFVGQERAQRSIEYAVRDSIAGFLSQICRLEMAE